MELGVIATDCSLLFGAGFSLMYGSGSWVCCVVVVLLLSVVLWVVFASLVVICSAGSVFIVFVFSFVVVVACIALEFSIQAFVCGIALEDTIGVVSGTVVVVVVVVVVLLLMLPLLLVWLWTMYVSWVWAL